MHPGGGDANLAGAGLGPPTNTGPSSGMAGGGGDAPPGRVNDATRRESQTGVMGGGRAGPLLDDHELIENPMYGMASARSSAVAAGVPLDCVKRKQPPSTLVDTAAGRLPAKEDLRYPAVSERADAKRWSAVTSRPDLRSRHASGHRQPPQHPDANRMDRVRSYVRQGTSQFFGLDEADDAELQARWLERRRRLASKVYGRLKDDDADSGMPQMSLPSDDVVDRVGPRPPCSKQHVARITWDGIVHLVRRTADARSRRRAAGAASGLRTGSRSFALAAADGGGGDELDSCSASAAAASAQQLLPLKSRTGEQLPVSDEVFFDRIPCHPEQPPLDYTDHRRASRDSSQWRRPPFEKRGDPLRSPHDLLGPRGALGGPIAPPDAPGAEVGRKRISSQLLDRVFDNSNRRQFGRGLAGKVFGGWALKRSVAGRQDVRQQVDDMEDHRPYFTYWVTTVQTLVLLISIACYGFGPVGFELKQQSGRVLDISLSLQQVDYWEPPNLWLGPRAADLIHLGAKFAPCMRRDEKIQDKIRAARNKERFTACCIRNDNSGCVQSAQAECSNTISTWKRWSEPGRGPEGRMYGSVCGLDPRFCSEPRSRAPYEWPEDITKWPICRKTAIAPKGADTVEHMLCEVVGHPCCVGIHGRCQITTREYCSFVRGYFHEEAALCSQVSCLDDVCGMMPFFDPDTPDQFYRLWTSLFLHAGLIHLVFTVLIQFFFLRDLEKMAGPVRIGIIYVASGIGGNMASAIFVPYRAEVGPAGSQFGLLACHFVEVLNAWPMLRRPWRAFLRLCSLTMVLLIIGLLPWVDNYAHVFGFLVGFLLSYALLPYVTFGPYDGARKKVLIIVCAVTVTLLVLFLIVLFYVTPFYECTICEYFNCIPLTRDFCAEQNIEFDRRTDL